MMTERRSRPKFKGNGSGLALKKSFTRLVISTLTGTALCLLNVAVERFSGVISLFAWLDRGERVNRSKRVTHCCKKYVCNRNRLYNRRLWMKNRKPPFGT